MNELKDNPELQKIGADLMAAAEAADSGKVTEPAKTEAAEPVKDDNRQPSDAKQGQATGQEPAKADAEKSESNKADASSKVEASEGEPKETKYQKAKKDAERLDKSWKALNEEKEKLRAEREAIEKAKAAKPEPKETSQENFEKYSPEELEQAALAFQQEGRNDLAQLAMTEAQKVRQRIEERKAQGSAEQMQKERAKHWNEALAENPWLNDPTHALAADLAVITERFPFLTTMPDGIKHAVQVVKLRAQASKASTLEKRIAELEAEKEKLIKATSISSAPPSDGPVKAKDFNSMSADEQRAFLEKNSENLATGDVFG